MSKNTTDFPRQAFGNVGLALGLRSPGYQFEKGVKAGVIEKRGKLYHVHPKRALKYARKHGIRIHQARANG